MSELKNKVLEEYIKRIISEKNPFGLNVNCMNHEDPLEGILSFLGDLGERNVKAKQMIHIGGTLYWFQLYSDKGSDYINEQLKELGEQQNDQMYLLWGRV